MVWNGKKTSGEMLKQKRWFLGSSDASLFPAAHSSSKKLPSAAALRAAGGVCAETGSGAV